ILPASISRQTGLSALRQQRAVHDVNINISFLRMAERARQSANDLETELLPKMDCRRVRRNHKIELHGAKAHSTGLAQTMLGDSSSDSRALCISRHYKGGVGDVRTAPSLV